MYSATEVRCATAGGRFSSQGPWELKECGASEVYHGEGAGEIYRPRPSQYQIKHRVKGKTWRGMEVIPPWEAGCGPEPVQKLNQVLAFRTGQDKHRLRK